MNNGKKNSPARRVALLGILFALALALSYLESLVTPWIPIPGVKLGISNIVVMYCVFVLGTGPAYLLGALKSLFVLLVRGMSGAFLSLAGGLLSITVMVAARRFLRRDSYTPVSILGAVAHNTGQLACAALLLKEGAILWYYLPVLAAVGVLVGTLTAVLLRGVIPVLHKI